MDSPHQGQVMQKTFPSRDVIMNIVQISLYLHDFRLAPTVLCKHISLYLWQIAIQCLSDLFVVALVFKQLWCLGKEWQLIFYFYTFSIYRGYPAKRALSAMRKHSGRVILAGYPRFIQCTIFFSCVFVARVMFITLLSPFWFGNT